MTEANDALEMLAKATADFLAMPREKTRLQCEEALKNAWRVVAENDEGK